MYVAVKGGEKAIANAHALLLFKLQRHNHLGEATVTRATVAVHTGQEEAIGTAYVLGSRPEHAGLAAIFDGLLRTSARESVLREVIVPLELEQQQRDAASRRDARATVVDFFTVARENDGIGAADDEDDE